MLRKTLLIMLLLGTASPAWAGTWAEAMFEEFTYDFGAIPRQGPVVVHPFRIVNNSKFTVHISEVRAGCGCTTAYPLQYTLAPGQETAIIAQMNPRSQGWFGVRSVEINVTFDRPEREVVKLAVTANSREDLLFNPQTLEFGKIKRGTTPTVPMTVSFYGQPQAQVTDVKCESNYVQATVQQLRRDNNEVTYQVSAKVRPDIPEGKWYTDIWLSTNVAAMPKLRLPLNIEVEPVGKVIVLPPVKTGVESNRNVTLTGTQPFRITGIQGADQELSVRAVSNGSEKVHVISLTFRPSQAGQISRTIRITTDMTNAKELEFSAQTQSVP